MNNQEIIEALKKYIEEKESEINIFKKLCYEQQEEIRRLSDRAKN